MEPIDPEQLRVHYSRFLDGGATLLTGHSHQAWPDAAREGVLRAFDDAAAHADDKWALAADAADAVRRFVAERIGGEAGDVALAQNSHELVYRFLSALPRLERVVTTSGEFHSMRRQLSRLEESGLEVVWVDRDPVETLALRLAQAVDERTDAVLTSTILFRDSAHVPDLEQVCRRAFECGAQVLFDVYHHVGVRRWKPIDERAFVVGGGYKYLQWGEGACFMRVPPKCNLRPRHTGWFAEFATLSQPAEGVVFGDRGSERFAGSTYDPTSHYRARAVIEFFEAQGLTPERVEANYARQCARIRQGLEGFDVLTPSDAGGFVAVRCEEAERVVAALRERKIYVDARGDALRFGPAPYLRDDEIDAALAAFRELA